MKRQVEYLYILCAVNRSVLLTSTKFRRSGTGIVRRLLGVPDRPKHTTNHDPAAKFRSTSTSRSTSTLLLVVRVDLSRHGQDLATSTCTCTS